MKRSLALQFWQRLNEEPSELILGTKDHNKPMSFSGFQVGNRLGQSKQITPKMELSTRDLVGSCVCWCFSTQSVDYTTSSGAPEDNFLLFSLNPWMLIWIYDICVVYCIVMWRKLCSRFCLAPLSGIFLACTVSCIPSKKCQWKVRIQLGISIIDLLIRNS